MIENRYAIPELLNGEFGELNRKLLDRNDDEFTVSLYEDDNVRIKGLPFGDTIEYHGRILYSVLVESKRRNKRWVQPMYRSTGRATPGATSAGDWRPFSGVFCDTAIQAMYPGDNYIPEGWIGKHYWCPNQSRWKSHSKHLESLPGALQNLCGILKSRTKD